MALRIQWDDFEITGGWLWYDSDMTERWPWYDWLRLKIVPFGYNITNCQFFDDITLRLLWIDQEIKERLLWDDS